MIRWIFLILFASASASAQVKYHDPEKQIVDLVSSPGFSQPFYNSQLTEFVKYRNQTTPSVEYTNRPLLKLAGVRFNPQNTAPFSGSYLVDLRYFDQKIKKDKAISFDKKSYIRGFAWSPNGKKLAVQVEAPQCVELWIVDIPSTAKKKISDTCLNNTLMRKPYTWLDDERILALRRSSNKEVNVSRATPVEVVVRESLGGVSQNRTYQDLLKTPQDSEAFSQAASAKITVINLKSSAKRDLGPADAYNQMEASPNKKWIFVSRLEKPFSYVVPYYFFKSEKSLWSMDGKLKKSLGEQGPFENIPIQGTITGPREHEWDPTQPQRFLHVEAQDKGDWKVKVPFRDFLYMNTVDAHGNVKTEKIAQFENRFSGVEFLEDASQGAVVFDYERDREMLRYFQLKPAAGSTFELKEFLSRNRSDDYTDPGMIVTERNQYDRQVGRIQKTSEGDFIYWTGRGATPTGERPFISKMNLQDKKFTEVFRSSADKYESGMRLFPKEFSKFIVRSESATEAPVYEVRSMAEPSKKGTPIFEEENPFKVMGQLKRKMLKYKRKDGVEMTGVLYYPLDYKEGQKYPAVVWAYPLEYTDAKSAGQTRGATTQFETPIRATPLYFALRGYFVLMDAQMPIVGHPETKNDTFIEQLTMDADGTIKALEETGSIDIKRVGVVGHSYGAFMVAHLLTHTNLFAAGIARSGAYNRTLTPFGFQGERRTFWEAKSSYLKLSPFLDADKMKHPLLLIHGLEDDNPGTFTLQSERYFDALKGQGATARLVLLPTEPHGYAAQESVKHVLWESFTWFDKYLKDVKN